jgi:glutamate synthase domain-containing protein 3
MGGLVWLYVEEGKFLGNGLYHRGFLQPQTWDEPDADARGTIRSHIENHWSRTSSGGAEYLLGNWEGEAA